MAPIVVVRGPRRVGKTVAQLQVIESLLSDGVSPNRILRVQFDDVAGLLKMQSPIKSIVEWFEARILRKKLNASARAHEPAFMFFDEVQNLDNWAAQLKHLVDSSTVYAVVTGSSALRIELGRDSLAGRIQTIEVGTLTLREISKIRFGSTLRAALPDADIHKLADKSFWYEVRNVGLEQRELRDEAFDAFSERGGYPLVHEHMDVPWEEMAPQLVETVIRRVIRHDLRVGETKGRKRDEGLLEEVFRMSCRYAGQAPQIRAFVEEVQHALAGNVGPARIRHYLEFLERALLLRAIRPLEIRLKKAKGANKLCLADHGLRAAWLGEKIPLSPAKLRAKPELADLAGHLAESVLGAYLLTIPGLTVNHFPARNKEPEVDFVLTIGDVRIPVEVKYRRRAGGGEHTEGLRHFMGKLAYRAPFGVLVTQNDDDAAEDPNIISVPLSTVLMIR
ncbi:ATP-binding protein [Sorangium sp. So ce363]|uniref:ATP-binding protein n=1 Tax=Sorangium sp. So ce363 TaxID=3133304 RepID=UPI003F612828